jgi:hypothetical protein
MESFPLFPCFPPEMRIHIWTQALWMPRIAQLCFGGEDGYDWDIRLISRIIPPLLCAYSKSRAAALKAYPHQYYEMQNTSLKTYINFEIDMICLTSAVLGY